MPAIQGPQEVYALLTAYQALTIRASVGAVHRHPGLDLDRVCFTVRCSPRDQVALGTGILPATGPVDLAPKKGLFPGVPGQ